MLISKKRVNHMQSVMRKQADSIYVFAKEREKLLNELLLAQEAQDRIAEELAEAEKNTAAAESRNEILRKAFEAMQECLRRSAAENARLRKENESMSAVIDRLAAENNPLLLEAAYTVADA